MFLNTSPELIYSAQLESYYECFLQIEKENNILKQKIEQMKLKLNSYQNQDQVSKHDLEKTEHSEEVCEKVDSEEVNKLSMKHVDEEMTNLNQSVSDFIKEKQNEKEKEPKSDKELNSDEIKLKIQRIDELELEKDALNKKLNNIESSLARWIFRACDYKSDVTKSNEKCQSLESKISDMNQELNEVKEKHRDEVESLQSKLNDYVSKIDELNLKLSSKEKEISEVNKKLNDYQEIANSKRNLDVAIQTEIEATSSVSNTKLPNSNSKTGLVAQAAAKLNQMLVKNGEANQTEESSTKISNEIFNLKAKIDSLILERNSFKIKNEELTRELNEKLDSIPVNNKTAPTHQPKSEVNMSTQTDSHKLTSNQTQTESNSNIKSKINILETNNQSCIEGQLKNKIDQMKKDLDSLKLKATKDQSEFTTALEDKSSEIARLEQVIKNNKISISNLSKEIEELNEKLNKQLEENESLKRTYESKFENFNSNLKVEKQISDTIIQQQKKLLDYLQMKLNGENPNSGTESTSSESNGHSNIINLLHKKFNKTSNQNNPLLANLQKTTNQQFINKQQELIKQSKEIVTTTKKMTEIETELNSNYEAYSILKSKNKVDEQAISLKSESTNAVANKAQPAAVINRLNSNCKSTKKQIHVFITGLNTSPTYW